MRILLPAFFAALAIASYQDMKNMEIKDGCPAAIAILAVLAILAEPGADIRERLLGALCISAPMLALTLLIPGAFGGGDIKLMAAGGLFLGWKSVLVAAVIAVFLAGGYVLLLIINGKARRGMQFALGPSLSAGMAVAALWGERLWQVWLSL